jgi:hypothetical protein
MKQGKVSEFSGGSSKTGNVHGGKQELDPRKHKLLLLLLLLVLLTYSM